jgi:hypothetical protein
LDLTKGEGAHRWRMTSSELLFASAFFFDFWPLAVYIVLQLVTCIRC